MCATAFNQTLRSTLRAALNGNKDADEIGTAEIVRQHVRDSMPDEKQPKMLKE